MDLRTALFGNQPPEGGLYLPRALPRFTLGELRELRAAGSDALLEEVARRLFAPPLSGDAVGRILRAALDFPLPLVPLADAWVLELFHGPTLAFKDVGARFMARLMAELGDGGPLTVLVATSGDTGSAVAQAFAGLPGARVVVLFPDGRVSPLQERQFSTLGGNVRALAVRGSFDDCQRLAKQAFADPELRRRLRLTSANSINIGRLLPQVLYYFHAWAELPREPSELLFSVPSGNFGNLTAGLLAARMGLPVSGFVAATNANRVVPDYLETGRYQPAASVRTLATAMDVGEPSNFERMRALYPGGAEALGADVQGVVVGDDVIRETIRAVHGEHGYVLDPHGAVAWAALGRVLRERPAATGVALATAHPAKFPEVVEPVIGRPLEVPEALAACLARERRVEPLGARFDALREALLGEDAEEV
ncbi:MAG TPA: threonine synthase [Longimicrobiales bacterium]|nr:threonine synthase [Longimicrobiales bacterium]